MDVEDLKKNIKPEWREEFGLFIKSGEASQGFLEYLDRDEACQEALEQAFEEQAAGLKDIAQALKTDEVPTPDDDARGKMGEILVDSGVITTEQLDEALAEQHASENTRLGAILVDLRMASEDVVAQALAFQRNVEFVRIKSDTVQRDAARLISGRLAEQHGCVPISALNHRLTLAMINPLDLIAIEEVERATDYTVEPVVATPSEIFSAIKKVYAK